MKDPIKSYTKKDGKTYYMFKLYLGIDSLTGKQIHVTRRGFQTKKEASLTLAQLRVEVSKGEYKKPITETYEDLYNVWIQHYERTVEESTFVKTIGIFRNHILPALGHYRIEKLSIAICQGFVDDCSLKLKRFRMVKTYASKVIDFAIKREYISSNPFKLVDLPKIKTSAVLDTEVNYYSKEQLINFLQCLKQYGNAQITAFYYLLAFSGIRKGEALALTWADINFDTKELLITKALSRGKKNKLYIKSTKTDTIRQLLIDDETCHILSEWKQLQLQKFPKVSDKNQLMFANEQNKFLQQTIPRRWLMKIIDKYNLPYTHVHSFRHVHCSLLFEAGASVKEVQERLGHTDVQTTLNIYTHLSKRAKNETINKFVTYLNS
ncbi:site-specific integrase [Lysinibacillus sp. A4]|uniref:site-specific integrase n=1 Tax=unclassified Lysinibacillus TaxID=2636778 RepID=UPI002175FE0B|nr:MULTISPECIES: site-specific integrase [unclassified Lysinibacillus]MCS5503052.1 site-specific integrase [Lysinibacillus sp. A4]WGT39961.1 site-specific integrase [Lysinibacillus sp. 1 U-2021]